MVGPVANTDKRDMDAHAAEAERLDRALEEASAAVAAEMASRSTPTLTEAQWVAFDKFLRTGYSPRGKTAAALVAAGLLLQNRWGFARMPFANEVARRRREGSK